MAEEVRRVLHNRKRGYSKKNTKSMLFMSTPNFPLKRINANSHNFFVVGEKKSAIFSLPPQKNYVNLHLSTLCEFAPIYFTKALPFSILTTLALVGCVLCC